MNEQISISVTSHGNADKHTNTYQKANNKTETYTYKDRGRGRNKYRYRVTDRLFEVLEDCKYRPTTAAIIHYRPMSAIFRSFEQDDM